MGVDNIRVNRVAGLLDRLRAYCDTGFALAIHIRYTRPSLLYRTMPRAGSTITAKKASCSPIRWCIGG